MFQELMNFAGAHTGWKGNLAVVVRVLPRRRLLTLPNL
jgi:hypothetical protein